MTSVNNSANSTQKSPDTMNRLNHIHHALANISGGLVLAVVKRKLSRTETLEWIKTLRSVAKELEGIVNGK